MPKYETRCSRVIGIRSDCPEFLFCGNLVGAMTVKDSAGHSQPVCDDCYAEYADTTAQHTFPCRIRTNGNASHYDCGCDCHGDALIHP